MRGISLTLAVLTGLSLAACQTDEAAKNENSAPASVESRVMTEVDEPTDDVAEMIASYQNLNLPEFPDYPEPATALESGQEGVIYFPTRSPYDFSVVLNDFEDAQPTTGMGTLYLPDGASADNPVPAMVIMHGSGGISEGREHEYAALFNKHGIAGFVVDYYAPRGVTPDTPYVMKTMAATEVDLIADAYAALDILATHPNIDAGRIGVTGYSYGGMATRYALDARLPEILSNNARKFALHVDVYGPCHQVLGHDKTTGAPYIALYGDKDNSVDPEACDSVQEALRQGGSEVEAHLFKGAGHAWEVSRPLGEFGGGYIRGCTFSFEPGTGHFMINDKVITQPEPDMNREERAFVRASLGEAAGPCVGMGYIVGNDPETDKRAKEIMIDYMKRKFGL